MDFNPLVTVNILSFNRKDYLRTTLKKIFEQDYKNLEVLVIDNASNDGTEEMLKNEFRQVRFFKLNKNIGISAWNIGFEKAKGDFILVLDDDSYPLHKTINKGLEEFRINNKLGIVAFKIFNVRVNRFETLDFDLTPKLFVGCGALIRKEVIKKIGGYSEDIFIYYNEIDFSARCYNAGFDIVYLQNAIVIHNQSTLSRGNENKDPFVSKYRFFHNSVSYSSYLFRNFYFKYIVIYFLKWNLNRLIISFKTFYLTTFVKFLIKVLLSLKKIIKGRKVLNCETQKFYEFGNVPLIDKEFFPNFNKQSFVNSFKFKKKPALLIYFNNLIAFCIYKILSLFFKRTQKPSDSILFINTGQIGDLTISSSLLDSDDKFKSGTKIYFLIKKEYSNLFKDYKGRVKLIYWNYKKYKYSFFYRIKFLKKINSYRIKDVYNLTAARGITVDELALLSGGENIFCLNSNWLYLKKIFCKKMNSYYDKVLCEDILNEYEKHSKILEKLNLLEEDEKFSFKSFNLKINAKKKYNSLLAEPYITISPLASDFGRCYGIEKFISLCGKLSSLQNIVLLGSRDERHILNKIIRSEFNIFNLAGELELNEVPAVIKRSKLFIGNDSGLSHIALKLNVPMIAIIGGGNFGRYFPYKQNANRIFLYHQTDCFGCEWNCVHNEKYCLTRIPVESVFDSAKKLLGVT